MLNWYKKLLSASGSLLLVGSISNFVSSCSSNSFEKILSRTWDKNVYKSVYNYNITSWNTSHSMQAEDSKIWANTFETFLSSDKYGRIYGSLANSLYGQQRSGQEKYPYIGYCEDNGKKWTYSLREMNWVDSSGQLKIKNADVVEGVKRAAWYALNPINGSDVVSFWTSFIKGAREIRSTLVEAASKLAKKEISQEEYNKITEEQKNKIFKNENKEFGIYKGEDWNGSKTIVFDLIKPSLYFESLLNYSVFSPIDDLKNATTDFRDTKYNGPFYVAEANPNGKIVLKKNEYYPLKDNVFIDTLEYNYLADLSPAKTRVLFEAGSISEFELKSDDLKGWINYIGKGKENYDNPKFQYSHSSPSVETPGTYILIYNFYDNNMDDPVVGAVEQKRALNASKLLQSKEARAFISTSLNRSEMARYYSKTIDEIGKPSSVLRNTFTGPEVAKDENNVDYTQYVANIYENGGEIKELPNSEILSLKDGQDPYYKNSEKLIKKSQSQLIEDINNFININNIEKTKVKSKKNNKRVVLKLLLSPANNTSFNPYVNMMVKCFNEIENNPIYIETKILASVDDYVSGGMKGATDLYITGWLPDYKDPSSFLETLMLKGSYSSYNGNYRLFKNGVYDKKSIPSDLLTKSIEDTSQQDSSTKQVFDIFKHFTDNFLKTDKEKIKLSERYQEFAKEEYEFYYQNFMALTLYTKGLPKIWNVSYVNPYTKSYEPFGTSKYKFYNLKLSEKLWDREQVLKEKEIFEKKLKEVKKDWTSNREGVHWSK